MCLYPPLHSSVFSSGTYPFGKQGESGTCTRRMDFSGLLNLFSETCTSEKDSLKCGQAFTKWTATTTYVLKYIY